MVFGYALVSSVIAWTTTGNMNAFLLVFTFYICCLIEMLILLFCDKHNLKRYKQVYIIKRYAKSVIPYRDMTTSIIYYDFESCECRTVVCRGKVFDKYKYRVQVEELKDKTQKLCFRQHAQERFERLVEQMKQAQGITEELKAENALEWTGKMNNIWACAREIVNEEIIYS